MIRSVGGRSTSTGWSFLKTSGPTPPEPAGSPSPAAIRRAVEEEARSIGFDRLGVAGAELPPEADRFTSWLRRGHQGRMGWMARGAAKRLDPGLVLPGTRTILVGSVRYAPQPPPAPGPVEGRTSSYAWGDDYHLVVGAMAAELALFVRREYGVRALDYVDTGPILERMWAARAGLGWIGKNAMVLNKDHGSLFFLAVILTDLALPPDAPAVDQCGACTLCMEACPTGAIVEPRVVDSRRCVSYHSIELRGEYPPGHREELGDRAFGCDDCQTACPWNEDLVEPPRPFLPREGNDTPDLLDLMGMELPEYTRRFRGSSMKRATYHGLRRNAAIAAGNLLAHRRARDPREDRMAPGPEAGDRQRLREALKALAGDGEPSVAEAARWALAQESREEPDHL